MNIQILSDLHLEFDSFAIDYSKADVVVLAGDIHVGDKGIKWALQTIRDIPVVYVLGNHEYYGHVYPKLVDQLKKMAHGSNVVVLENDSAKIGDVHFYGCTLWTDFKLFGDARIAGYECQQRMSDFRKIRREPTFSKIRSIDIALINQQSLRWLKKESSLHSGKSVVVTHHAPSALSVPEQYKNDIVSAAYASHLDELVKTLSPELWIHGHMHECFDYKIHTTRVVCNPRGYSGENTDFNSQCIVSV